MGAKGSQAEQSEDRGDMEAGMGMSATTQRWHTSEVKSSKLIFVSCTRQEPKSVCSSCEQSMGLKALLLPLLTGT